jgi:hypothetical protein
MSVSVNCPHCSKDFEIEPSVSIPKEQVIYLSMESTNTFFPPDVIGGQIQNMGKLLQSVAKDIGGKIAVFVKSIELDENKVKIGFLVVDAPSRKPKVAKYVGEAIGVMHGKIKEGSAP